VIALDPDIPRDLQKVFFVLQTPQKGVTWVLNGRALPSAGKAIPWSPQSGRYHLALQDEEGRPIDSVRFEVRGAGPEEIQDQSENPEGL